MPQPYKVFTMYAREDAQYLEELRGQLRPLENAGRIKVWSDCEINPGAEWEKEIVQKLDTADVILILVSSAYYNSAYIHDVEIKYALERHERGEARVLPIIVRPCSFGDDPIISRLKVLPTDGKPVTDRRHWPERDEAWLDVVKGLKRTLAALQTAEHEQKQAILDAQRHQQAEKDTAAEKQRLEEARLRQNAERTETERREAARREREDAQQREREQAAIDADSAAWQQAAEANDGATYAYYLARYPQGIHAREARARTKALKKKNETPVAWQRYAAIAGGLLVLALAVWLWPNSGASVEVTQSRPDTTATMTQSRPDTANPGPKTRLSEKKTVEKPQEKENQQPASTTKELPTANTPPAVNTPFNYPMKNVQGGSFTMGSPTSEEGRDNDECPHAVTVGSFSMGKYEVTQAQWKAIMGNNPSKFAGCDDCPVEQVSWNEVQEFIKKLNGKTGKSYRLPTEAEWEYAAKGGTQGRGYKYSGGNTLSAVAWCGENSGSKTHAVGGKLPNELGLYDMSGNVWEWCQDTYKPYPGCTGSAGSDRVNRGGSWFNDAQDCRAAFRINYSPDYRINYLGFRLALSLQ